MKSSIIGSCLVWLASRVPSLKGMTIMSLDRSDQTAENGTLLQKLGPDHVLTDRLGAKEVVVFDLDSFNLATFSQEAISSIQKLRESGFSVVAVWFPRRHSHAEADQLQEECLTLGAYLSERSFEAESVKDCWDRLKATVHLGDTSFLDAPVTVFGKHQNRRKAYSGFSGTRTIVDRQAQKAGR
jgi:hypothetical protein